ncbi:MAG: hypothetical protein KDB80_06650 [Planctomycetes bacterium]|nr:hypothetical protein [Planctomycetota bacterium]
MRNAVAVALSAFVLTATGCVGVGARAYVGFTQTEVTGDFSLDSTAGGADLSSIRNDIENDFGITDASPSIWVKAEIEAPAAGRFSLSGFTYSEQSSGTLTNAFGDVPAGSAISTDLKFDNVKAAWTFDALDLEAFYLSPGLAIDVFSIDTRVSSTSPVAFEDVDTLGFVPMLYARSGVDLSLVALDVEAGWMTIDLGDADGDYFDLEGMLRLSVAPAVEVVAGYRYISIDGRGEAEGQRFEADLEMRGWFVGGGVVF